MSNHFSYQQADSLGIAPIDVFQTFRSTSASADLAELDLPSQFKDAGASNLDVKFWLPFAAKELNISPNVKDYVVVPTVGFWTDVPNVNGDCVELAEAMRWDTNMGMCAYKTFKGKGTFYEHQENTKPHMASGVIFDTFIAPMPWIKGNHYRLLMLLGYDRTKNPELANQILKRQMSSYSVGMSYPGFVDSINGQLFTENPPPGSLTRINQPTYRLNDGRLVFRYLKNICGFETSAVNIPAFNSAIGDTVIDLQQGKTQHYD